MDRVLRADEAVPGFAEIFSRGLRWPGSHPLRVVVLGAEGSGKTSLALQLATGAVLGRAPRGAGDQEESTPRRRWVFYYTPDDLLDRVQEKISAFGIDSLAPNVRVYPGEAGAGIDRSAFVTDEVRLCLRHLRCEHTAMTVVGSIEQDLKQADLLDCGATECFVVVDSIAPISEARDRLAFLGGECRRRKPEELPFPAAVFLTDEEWGNPGRTPYLTDVYIHLTQGSHSQAREEGFCERYLQVVKAANCHHARGVHPFHIVSGHGVEIWPSPQLQGDVIRRKRQEHNDGAGERSSVEYGIEGVDDALRPELKSESITLLTGQAGTLKTPQAMNFVTAELEADSSASAVFLSLSDDSSALRRHLKGCSRADSTPRVAEPHVVDLDTLDPNQIAAAVRERGEVRLLLLHIHQHFVSVPTALAFLKKILDLMEQRGTPVKRFVFDGVADIAISFPRLRREVTFLPLLVEMLRAYGCTSLFVGDTGHEPTDPQSDIMWILADNVLVMTAPGAERNARVLLQVQKLSNRPSGELPILELQRDAQGVITADPANERYARNEEGRLVPARVLMCLNRSVKAHQAFNSRISAAFAPAARLNEDLARERGASYRRQLEALSGRRTEAVVLAVDEAWLSPGSKILGRFCDLDARHLGADLRPEALAEEAMAYCWLDDKGARSLRLVPIALDPSVLLFHPRLITDDMPDEVRRLRECVEVQLREQDQAALPEIEMPDFLAGAKSYAVWCGDVIRQGSSGAPARFLDFCRAGRDSEHYFPLLLEWLKARQVDPCPGGVLAGLPRWTSALLEFGEVYLAGRRPDSRCTDAIFFRTWHSRAFSDSHSVHAIPVRLGKHWVPTRGGWFWGILDTGVGREIAIEVLKYALSPEMAIHRIAHRVYLPANKSLLCEAAGTGESSIYNPWLMYQEYRRAWKRSDMEGYDQASPFAYEFFRGYLDRLDRLGGSEPDWPRIAKWLDFRLTGLADAVGGVAPGASRGPNCTRQL